MGKDGIMCWIKFNWNSGRKWVVIGDDGDLVLCLLRHFVASKIGSCLILTNIGA